MKLNRKHVKGCTYTILLAVLVSASSYATNTEGFPLTFGGVNDTDNTDVVSINDNSDDTEALAIDGNGVIYVGGDTVGENINFSANGANTSTILATTKDGTVNTEDGYLTSFESNGTLRWVLLLQGAGNDLNIDSVTTDSNNDVYIVGEFAGAVDLNLMNTNGVINTLTSFTSVDNTAALFVAKLTDSGTLTWVKIIEKSNASVRNLNRVKASDIKVDSINNVYVVGDFYGQIDFDPSGANADLSSYIEEDDDHDDGFIVKLSSNGDYQWVKGKGGQNDHDSISSITFDSNNNVYIGGKLSSDSDGVSLDDTLTGLEFDATTDASRDDNTGSKSGEEFGFVQKLNNDTGNVIWSKTFLASTHNNSNALDKNSEVTSVSYDLDNNRLIAVGNFDNATDFQPSASVEDYDYAEGDGGFDDLFVVSLTEDGDYIWHGTLGNNDENTDEGADAVHVSGGNIYIAADIYGTEIDGDGDNVSFDTWSSSIPASNGDQDAMVLKLNKDGELIWVKTFGGATYDTGDAFAEDPSGNVYLSGQFTSIIDLDPSPEVLNISTQEKTTLNNNEGRDAFLVKLTSNGTFSNDLSIPTISSVGYNSLTGMITVTGNDLSAYAGANNDIDASTFTFTGESGGTYTLTNTSDVEISSATSFTLELSATDKAAINALLNTNGVNSYDNTVYNLSVADNWNLGAAEAVDIAIATTEITVGGWPSISYSQKKSIDVSKVSYTEENYDFSELTTYGYDLAWNNDGSKFFLVDILSEHILEFSLSTPYKLSTTHYDKLLDVSEQGNAMALTFNSDGSQLYLLTYQKTVYQYNLTTAFDLSTASYSNNSLDVSSKNVAMFLAFNSDGSKLFVGGNQSLHSFTLSTPFDITTASDNNQSLDLSNEVTEFSGGSFNTDGTVLLVVNDDEGTSNSFQYSLATPFDLSTATYSDKMLNLADEIRGAHDVEFDNQSNMYFVDRIGNTVKKFTDNEINNWTETASNNGSVSTNSITISLMGDTFVNNSGTLVEGTHYTLPNKPAGLTSSIAVAADGLVATLTLASSATQHEAIDSVADVKVTFLDAAFTIYAAANVTNSVAANTGVSINFNNETTPATVTENTPVPASGSNPTPSYTFASDEAGTFIVGGACGTSSANTVIAGNNTITLTATDNETALSVGTYNNCTITVTDKSDNVSAVLTISTFEITPNQQPELNTTDASNSMTWVNVGNAGFTNAISTSEPSAMVFDIAPDGTKYVAYKNSDNKLSVDAFINGSWQAVGNVSSVSNIEVSDLALTVSASGVLFVGYSDSSQDDKATVIIYERDSWVMLDEGFSEGSVSSLSLGVNGDDVPYIAFRDEFNGENKATVMKMGEGEFEELATRFTADALSKINITFGSLDDPFVGYYLPESHCEAALTNANNAPFIISVPCASYPYGMKLAVDSNDNLYYAYLTYNGSALNLNVLFNGQNENEWSHIGGEEFTNYSTYGLSSFDIKLDENDIPYVAFSAKEGNDSNDTITVKSFANGTWNTINQGDFATGEKVNLSFDEDNKPNVAYLDTNQSNKVSVSQLDSRYTFTTLESTNNSSLFFDFSATDIDGDDNLVTYTLAGTDSELFTLDNATGELTFIDNKFANYSNPLDSDSDNRYQLIVTVTDTLNAVQSYQVEIQVLEANQAPVISGNPAQTIAEDANYSFTPSVTDADDGDSQSFSIINKPSWATFSTSTGTLSGTPKNSDVGTTSGIIIRVRDNADASASLPSFNITVVNTNDAPVLTGDPVTTVAQGGSYKLTLTATDEDANDTKTFSIINKPAWAIFNTATGELTGVPTASDVGTTTGIIITVIDGAGATHSIASFDITVSNVNDAPIISGAPSITVDQGETYSFTPTVFDIDANDTQTFSIINKPSWATFNAATGALTGIPSHSDVGATSGIVISVKDSENASASLAAFTLTVINVNDAPIAVADNITLPISTNNSYQLAVLNNDSDDDGDTLSITGAQASIGNVTTDGDTITFTSAAGFVGSLQLTYTITDGNQAYADTTVSLTIEGDSDQAAPVITVPDTVEVNATGLYTKVDLGTATAVNSQGKSLPISLVDGKPLFRPGNNVAYWQATDPDSGLVSIASQKVIVHPLVSLSKDQTVVEGETASVQVILNGEAPSYPVAVSLSLSGDATSTDYHLNSMDVIISSGTQTSVTIDILKDEITEDDETLTLNLIANNVGSNGKHHLTITEQNFAPAIALSARQNGENRQVIIPDDGDVNITAKVNDINGDNVTLAWSYEAALNVSEQSDNGLTLSPQNLAPGIYSISLTATDDGAGSLSNTQTLYLEVLTTLAVLTDEDTDGDMIPDSEEGYGDSDQDGIPDFQDAIAECNVMPEQLSVQNGFLVEGEPGVCLRKGNTLAGGETGGLQLTNDDIARSVGLDEQAVIIGGIFDFIVTGLPEAGQNYKVVLPQRQPIPAEAVYRKYSDSLGWSTFVEDVNNQLHSTAGEQGYCPPPTSTQWTTGLTEGHWCVQLTIEDGGPNDNDNLVNSTIVDPGGVSVIVTDNITPVAMTDEVRIKRNETLLINVLENDTDADGDSLSIGVATATFGSVIIETDNQLSYTTKADFVGEDTIVYSVSDGKGGTSSAQVNIAVYANEAPQAVDDIANTDDREAIIIDVLANDSDADEDALSVTSATVDNGSVNINDDNTITYMPTVGFSGTAIISYTVDDGEGDEATAQVEVTVVAYQTATVTNKSSGGGSMGMLLFGLLGLAVLYRQYEKDARNSSLLLTVFIAMMSSANANATDFDWFVTTSVGQSTAKAEQPKISEINAITWDDSDTSYSLGAGLAYDNFNFILSYENLGEAFASYTGDVLDSTSFHQTLVQSSPKLVDGLSLQSQYTLWQKEAFNISFGLGLLAWKLDYTSHEGESNIELNDNDIDVFYSLLLGYKVSEDTHLGIKATRYNLSINDVDNIAITLTYNF